MSSLLTPSSCAGDKINPLKGFDGGCLFARVAAGQTLILSGINLGVSTVTVERVIEGECDEKYYLPMQTPSGCALSVTDKTPIQPIKVAGYYRMCISPAAPDALLSQEYVDSDSAACCSINAQCQPAIVVPPPPPVTAAVTGLPCPLPASFVWNGATTTLSAFISDVKSQVSGAAYNAATCSFTAPAGSAFPSLATSAVVPPAIVYCPSQPLLDGGFGFHALDPKDPAATVEIAPCAGDSSVDSIWLYPAAGAGHTVKVLDCSGSAIGYGVNQSNCAASAPPPEMSVTVNNAAPVNNLTVEAPIVNVSPVNNFSPTTQVAAPIVNLPSPNVVAAGYDANGKLTITRSDGTLVQSSDLPSC